MEENMKKICLMMILLLSLNGCHQNNSEKSDVMINSDTAMSQYEVQLNNMDTKIKEVEKALQLSIQEHKVLEKKLNLDQETIDWYEFEDEHFRDISYLTLEFSRARSSGDLEALERLMSKNIKIFKRDEEILCTFEDTNNEGLLYFKNREKTYFDMNITYYAYNIENETFEVQTQEYFLNEAREITGTGFVIITFIEEDGNWKIDNFNYDI